MGYVNPEMLGNYRKKRKMAVPGGRKLPAGAGRRTGPPGFFGKPISRIDASRLKKALSHPPNRSFFDPMPGAVPPGMDWDSRHGRVVPRIPHGAGVAMGAPGGGYHRPPTVNPLPGHFQPHGDNPQWVDPYDTDPVGDYGPTGPMAMPYPGKPDGFSAPDRVEANKPAYHPAFTGFNPPDSLARLGIAIGPPYPQDPFGAPGADISALLRALMSYNAMDTNPRSRAFQAY